MRSDERIDVEKMENDRIAKRGYVEEFAGRPWKKERGLYVRQTRRMVHA